MMLIAPWHRACSGQPSCRPLSFLSSRIEKAFIGWRPLFQSGRAHCPRHGAAPPAARGSEPRDTFSLRPAPFHGRRQIKNVAGLTDFAVARCPVTPLPTGEPVSSLFLPGSLRFQSGDLIIHRGSKLFGTRADGLARIYPLYSRGVRSLSAKVRDSDSRLGECRYVYG